MIRAINALPVGVNPDVDNNPYLAPYKHFHDNPFKGTVPAPGFPGFDPTEPHLLLQLANQGANIVAYDGAGPRHRRPHRRDQEHPVRGEAGQRRLDEVDVLDQRAGRADAQGQSQLELQYLQIVMLDFFPKRDGTARPDPVAARQHQHA